MLRLTFLGLMDYANVMTNWTAAINEHSRHLEARCFTLLDHEYDYANKRDWCSGSPWFDSIDRIDLSDPALRRAVDWFQTSDVVVWAPEMVEGHNAQQRLLRRIGFGVDFRDPTKTYAVFHGGSVYRDNPSNYNESDAPFVLRILAPDNVSLAGDDPRVRIARYCLPEIPATSPPSDRTHVNHTPSNPETKGTAIIQRAVQRVRDQGISFDYEQTSPPVPHERVLRILCRSHVHIDQVHPIGGLGMNALEAAGAGNVVLCTTHRIGAAKELLQPWPIIDPGLTVESVEEALTQVLILSPEDLRQRMASTRQWLYEYFGYEALARWWEEMLAEV